MVSNRICRTTPISHVCWRRENETQPMLLQSSCHYHTAAAMVLRIAQRPDCHLGFTVWRLVPTTQAPIFRSCLFMIISLCFLSTNRLVWCSWRHGVQLPSSVFAIEWVDCGRWLGTLWSAEKQNKRKRWRMLMTIAWNLEVVFPYTHPPHAVFDGAEVSALSWSATSATTNT